MAFNLCTASHHTSHVENTCLTNLDTPAYASPPRSSLTLHVTGYAVGSLALVADSFHMLNDVMSLVVALYALKVRWLFLSILALACMLLVLQD